MSEELKTIGIISGKEGEGTTTMAISMATYCSSVKGAKTAVVEIGGCALAAMAETYFGACDNEKFTLSDVDYYFCNDVSRLAWIYSEGYEYVIINFSKGFEKYIEEVMRCSIKIVMGSVNLWRYDEYLKLCQKIKKIPGSDRWFHIVSGDGKDVKVHLKKECLAGMERVMISTPFVLGDSHLEFFQKIF